MLVTLRSLRVKFDFQHLVQCFTVILKSDYNVRFWDLPCTLGGFHQTNSIPTFDWCKQYTHYPNATMQLVQHFSYAEIHTLL